MFYTYSSRWVINSLFILLLLLLLLLSLLLLISFVLLLLLLGFLNKNDFLFFFQFYLYVVFQLEGLCFFFKMLFAFRSIIYYLHFYIIEYFLNRPHYILQQACFIFNRIFSSKWGVTYNRICCLVIKVLTFESMLRNIGYDLPASPASLVIYN